MPLSPTDELETLLEEKQRLETGGKLHWFHWLIVFLSLEEQRKTRPDFKIYPEHDEKDLFPITYIEPVEVNAKAVGLDMAHEINRYTAAKKSKQTGTAQITGPITLVQDAQKSAGFLFYAPFYNDKNLETDQDRINHFKGLVYAPFIFSKLMQGTLEKERRQVGVKITDDNVLLFDENHEGEADFDPSPLFKRNTTITMYGRDWNFEIWSKLSFRDANESSKPWVILIGGLIIDSLLLGLFIFLARSNRRAIRFANKMTEGYESKASHLNNIINKANDGLITINQKGVIQSFNPACEDVFGYKANEVIGENIKMLMPAPYHDEHDGYLQNYHDTGEKKIIGLGREVSGQRKDGIIFPMDLSVSELYSKGEKIYSGIIRDITQRKKAEDDLLQSNEELERFAYVASHDLQEPLRMVTNFTSLLNENYADKLDDEAKQYIEFANDGAKRMQGLVEDLLEYARLGGEGDRDENVDVNDILNLVKENLGDAISASKATITHDNLPNIRTNPVRFMRLFQNLIGNGLKYQNEGKAPVIHVSAEEKDGEWLFSIRDNGIGMKQEYCQKIFEPFKRLHGKSQYSGTGMGLSICRKIVENSNGEIWATSTPDEGSIFYFTIPIEDK